MVISNPGSFYFSLELKKVHNICTPCVAVVYAPIYSVVSERTYEHPCKLYEFCICVKAQKNCVSTLCVCVCVCVVLQHSDKPVHYGVVVDVAVTGTKKTVTIRSPVQVLPPPLLDTHIHSHFSLLLIQYTAPSSSLQFNNHLQVSVEVFSAPEMSRGKRSRVFVIPPEECYPVPIEKAQHNVFYIAPAVELG